MTTFAVNEKNDIYLGNDGNMVITETSIEATLQVCEHYAKAQRGEMVYQIQEGVPYSQTAFDDLNINQFRGQLGQQLLRVMDVVEIESLEVTQNSEVLEYTALIQTVFGEGELNGGL